MPLVGWHLLAIDPSLTKTGWALFNRELRLVRCGRMTGEEAVREGIVNWAERVIIEEPRARRGHRRPNDIIKLAVLTGRIVGSHPNAHRVAPEEWKGQLPKDVCWARAERVLSSVELRVCELCPYFDNNVQDAIALGLWDLKRLILFDQRH